MTDRLTDLTASLRELISARDVIKTMPDLTDEDREAILPYLADAISDCEYQMRREYEETDRPVRMYMGGAS